MEEKNEKRLWKRSRSKEKEIKIRRKMKPDSADPDSVDEADL